MGAGADRDRPREAPAVAVEHRQRPEIDRVLAHAAGDDVAERQQIGAAVVVDHALRVAGRPRGVVERDRVPLVVGHRPSEIRVAFGEEILVLDLAEALAGACELRVVVVDHERLRFRLGERRLHGLRELAVGDQHLRFAVVEREGDDRGIEARVEGVEHGAGHRHAVVAFEHRRRVRHHDGDRVAAADAALRKRRCEPARPGVELAVAAAERAVDDRGAVREDRGRALEEGERRQRLEIRRVLVEVAVVWRHRGCPWAALPRLIAAQQAGEAAGPSPP